MITNFPLNATPMSQVTPCQNVPVQTSQNNCQPFQQQQNVNQPMQTSPCVTHFSAQQGAHIPGSFSHPYQFGPWTSIPQQPQSYPAANPYQTSPLNPTNVPFQNQPSNYRVLPENIVDQIRSCVASPSPIFILPATCHQTTSPQNPSNLRIPANYPAAPPMYCPPSFFPYPLPLPMYEPFDSLSRFRGNPQRCGCCLRKPGESYAMRIDPPGSYGMESEDHQCSQTLDETICGRKNCPAALNLQALASQLLSMQGVIACAATRLVLRKVPGSNVTTPLDETVDKAKGALNGLTKDQLLTESRNAQQVNALINLHMTANPPANVIPVLTLVQLKVNLLKAQVESLVNKKLMENQGAGVESTGTIDPMVLALKTDAELREFLSALRQKECEERVNLNFAPYHSQRVIAQTRLNNIQSKVSQVEAEMDRRRATALPRTSPQVYQQFPATAYHATGLAQNVTSPGYSVAQNYESPDPFAIRVQSPRRLNLKPHVGSPSTTYGKAEKIPEKIPPSCSDKATSPDVEATTSRVQDETGKSAEEQSSCEECSCEDRTSSDESDREGKKKLRVKVDGGGNLTVTSEHWEAVPLMRFASNIEIVVDEMKEKKVGDPKIEEEGKPDSLATVKTDKDEAIEDKDEKSHDGTAGMDQKEEKEESAVGIEDLTSELQSEKKGDNLEDKAIRGNEDEHEGSAKLQNSADGGKEVEDNKNVLQLGDAKKRNQPSFRTSLLIFPRRRSSRIETALRKSSASDDQTGKRYTGSNSGNEKSRTEMASMIPKIEHDGSSSTRPRSKRTTETTKNNRSEANKFNSHIPNNTNSKKSLHDTRKVPKP